MRMALLTEGGYPYSCGAAGRWCDRLVRGLGRHQFDVYALGDGSRQDHDGRVPLPVNVRRVHTAPPEPAPDVFGAAHRARHGRRARRRFADWYAELLAAVCAGGGMVGARDRFARALYGLADFARDEGAPAALLRSEAAVRAAEHACRAPGASSAARAAGVVDLLAVTAGIAHLLRPLSLDWYGAGGLGSADLCHATSGGAAALTGLLARHYEGTPLLLTEHGMTLRTHYLARPAASAPVRALLAAFHRHLAAETYRQAACVTSGSARVRHWQERCGAPRTKLRTVHPGMDTAPFAAAGESGASGEPGTLVWAGRVEPGTDLITLLHAFAEVHGVLPWARLRIVGEPVPGPEAAAYAARCTALAARLFPGEAGAGRATGAGRDAGRSPVSFEEWRGVGGATGDERADGIAREPASVTAIDAAIGTGNITAIDAAIGTGNITAIDAAIGTGNITAIDAAIDTGNFTAIGTANVTGIDTAHACSDVGMTGAGGHGGHGGHGGDDAGAARRAEVYAAGSVVIRTGAVEDFPVSLVEAMLCGRATVSTDAGQVVDVIGGTGLVVPPRDPRALAEACVILLRHADRRASLGAAARARALELFTVEQNVAAFDRIYQDVTDHHPAPQRHAAAGRVAHTATRSRRPGLLRPGRALGATGEGALGLLPHRLPGVGGAVIRAASVGEGAR